MQIQIYNFSVLQGVFHAFVGLIHFGGTSEFIDCLVFFRWREQLYCDQHTGIPSIVLVAETGPRIGGKGILLDVTKYKWSTHTKIEVKRPIK